MKAILTLVVTSLLTLGWVTQAHANVGIAGIVLSGKAMCNVDHYDVTWTLVNGDAPEEDDLTVQTSDRASVPVGTVVDEQTIKTFTESVPGTSTSETLNITWSYPNDDETTPMSTTVALNGDCVIVSPVTPTPVVNNTPVIAIPITPDVPNIPLK